MIPILIRVARKVALLIFAKFKQDSLTLLFGQTTLFNAIIKPATADHVDVKNEIFVHFKYTNFNLVRTENGISGTEPVSS